MDSCLYASRVEFAVKKIVPAIPEERVWDNHTIMQFQPLSCWAVLPSRNSSDGQRKIRNRLLLSLLRQRYLNQTFELPDGQKKVEFFADDVVGV